MQQSNLNENLIKGVRSLLFNCADLKKTDKVYIISNPVTAHLGELIKQEALPTCENVEHETLEEFKIHGQEPNESIAGKMFNATVIFCITKMSMAHTKARLNANNNGVKYFSLPDYSDEVMSSPALLADFKSIKTISIKIADMLSDAEEIRLTTALGTDLTLNVKGRTANPAPGFCYDNILLASPPDGETNIAPNETLTNGVAVIDGSIPCKEIGLLSSPVTLTIKNGMVTEITGQQSETLTKVFDRLGNPKCRIVAEFGMGLNKLAELKGSMLEDEGTLGTIHLGIGSNKTIGGLNEVAFHLDHIIRKATVAIDGKIIMKDGTFVKELLELIN